MTRYLTPFPGLFARAIDDALNRAISLDTTAGERLAELQGLTIRLELRGLGIDLYFTGQGDRLSVAAESDERPVTTIRGTPAALLAMAIPDWRAPGNGVEIEGQAGTAQTLERLLRQLDPDWQSWLVEHLGPVWGHQAWRMIRDGLETGRRVSVTAADQTARYLREESGLLVTRDEADEFIDQVDELREAIDRLQGRISRGARS